MTKEELVDVYREWEDDKLVAAFYKKEDYTAIALDAMLAVIEERKLGGGAAKMLEKDRERQIELAVIEQVGILELQQKYEAQEIGEDLPARELALKSKNSSGVYFNCELWSHQRAHGTAFLLAFSLAGLVITILFICIDVPLDFAAWYSAIPTIILLALLVKLMKRKPVSCVLKAEGRKTKLIIQHEGNVFCATVPFTYHHYWTTVEIRGKSGSVTHPKLSLAITGDSKETIVIESNLGSLKNGPPAWKEYGQSDLPAFVPQGSKIYIEKMFRPVNLVKLKKILDGLHELHAERS